MPSAFRILAGAAVALAFSSAVAVACSCVRYPSAAAHLAEAEVVFRGQVTRVEARGADGMGDAVTTFRVQSVFKGRPGRTVRVRHGTSGAACGVTYSAGQSYLVLAAAGAQSLTTSLCIAPQFPEAEYRAAAIPAARGPR